MTTVLLIAAAVVLVIVVVAAVVWNLGDRGEAPPLSPAGEQPAAEVAPAVEPIEITSRYAEADGVSIDPNRIPAHLRHLLDYARTWAIGDDVERDHFMRSVPPAEKKAFVDAVDPLQDELAKWSAEHRHDVPVPDEVVLYDMMAEAAAEAVAELYPKGR
ncbi:MAG: hypothetical protein GX414_08730 [Acidobacteria bacterium]|nr:hypothetical protein [Acidobacteriota bacterium]